MHIQWIDLHSILCARCLLYTRLHFKGAVYHSDAIINPIIRTSYSNRVFIWRYLAMTRREQTCKRQRIINVYLLLILNDAVTVPLNTHICSMHEQRALRWANNRIRAKAYRRGGGYFSVHTAHDTRSVETKNPSKKSLLPGLEATPVTQR